MLTLADSVRVGSFTLFRDVSYPEGRRTYGPAFYVLPDKPRLALAPDGLPALDLLVYRLPPERSAGRSGGLLTLTAELGPLPEERAWLLDELRALPSVPDRAAVELRAMPFRSGSVALSFAGEGQSQGEAADFVRQVAGGGAAHLVAAQRASFLLDLTPAGAALAEQAFARGLAALLVRYDLVFEHRLDDVVLRVWCDARRAYDLAGAQGPEHASPPAELRATLIAERLAGIELRAERPLADAHRAALEALGHQLLDAALERAFLEPAGSAVAGRPAQARRLRAYDPAAQMTLNHTFSESYPAEQQAVFDDLLTVTLPPERRAERVRVVDLSAGFFDTLEVQFHCTADFERELLDKVLVHVRYDETGEHGRVQREAEFVFRDGLEVHRFRTDLADPQQRRYSYDVKVYYRGRPQPAEFSAAGVEGDVVVLDLDGRGLLRAGFELRDAPSAVVQAAIVDLEYPRQGLTHRLVLDGSTPQAEWLVVLGEPPLAYRYRITWVTRAGQRLEEAWQQTQRTRIGLDAPAGLTSSAQVQLISAGDFGDVLQIVVELRAPGEAGPLQAQFSFDAPGLTRTWQPHGVLAARPFRYEARRTLVLRDGSRRELDWTADDAPVLVVSDPLRFEVRVLARLLDLGGTLRLAVLELESLTPEPQRASFVLREPLAETRWTFRLSAPEAHTYRHRLTLHPRDGGQVQIPWQQASDAILVLRPSQP